MQNERNRTLTLLASVTEKGEVTKETQARFRSINELYRQSGDNRYLVVANRRGTIAVIDLVRFQLNDLIENRRFEIKLTETIFKTLDQAIAFTIIQHVM